MSSEIYGSILFADDVRQEYGGKQSIMGIYAESCVLDSYPVQMDRLAVVFMISCSHMPEDAKMEISIKGPKKSDNFTNEIGIEAASHNDGDRQGSIIHTVSTMLMEIEEEGQVIDAEIKMGNKVICKRRLTFLTSATVATRLSQNH